MTGSSIHSARLLFCGCIVASALLAACDVRGQYSAGDRMLSVAPKVLFHAKEGGPWWPEGLYVSPGDRYLCAGFAGDPGQSAVYLYDLASRSLSADVASDRRWVPLAETSETGVMLAAGKGESICRGFLRPGHGQLLDVKCITTTSGLATHLRAGTTHAVCYDDMGSRVVLLDVRDWSVHGSVVVPNQFTVLAAHDSAGLVALLGPKPSGKLESGASVNRVEVRLIRVGSGEVEATFNFPVDGEIAEGNDMFYGSFSRDGNALLIRARARETSYHVARRVEGAWLPSVTVHASGLQSAVALSDDSSRLACFRSVDPEKEQASLMIWSLDPLEMVREIQLRGVVWVRELVFSRDGGCLFLVDDKNQVGEIRLGDLGGV